MGRSGFGTALEIKDTDDDNTSRKRKMKVTESVLDSPDVIKLGGETLFSEPSKEFAETETRYVEKGEKPNKPLPPVHFYALESEQRILEVVKPLFVVVYDPDMGFVREMEVYKAENPNRPLKVYFLFYEDSTECRKFEASIRRENSAFEGLIRQKASMMIPVDQVIQFALLVLISLSWFLLVEFVGLWSSGHLGFYSMLCVGF